MRILFLTEGGSKNGLGHINRCIALADGFADTEPNSEIHFCIQTVGSWIAPPLKRDYKFEPNDWIDKLPEESFIRSFDLVVVDTYLSREEVLSDLHSKSRKTVFLIDSTKKYIKGGIILYPSIYATKELNELHELQLCGPNYALFTNELWGKRKEQLNSEILNVGISLGGVIYRDLLLEMVEKLKSVFRNCTIHYYGSLPLENVKSHGMLSKTQYIDELLSLDILVTNGGQSLNEALLLGIPTISLILADNQLKNVSFLDEIGATEGIDLRDTKDLHKVDKVAVDMNALEKRKNLSETGLKTFNDRGAVLAAKEIITHLT